jgi:glutaredoxin
MDSSKKLIRLLIVASLVGGFVMVYRLDSNRKVDITAVESGLSGMEETNGVEFTSEGLASVNQMIENTRPTIPPPTVAIGPVAVVVKKKPEAKSRKPKLPKVQVFRSRICDTCDRLEEYLADRAVVFERVFTDTASGKALFKRYKLKKVPMVRIGDKNYVGNDPVLLTTILSNFENPHKKFGNINSP